MKFSVTLSSGGVIGAFRFLKQIFGKLPPPVPRESPEAFEKRIDEEALNMPLPKESVES